MHMLPAGWLLASIAPLFALQASAPAPYPSVPLAELNAPGRPLRGIVDMHTHPMSHLAFGGKLFHGAPDVGSSMPTNSVRCGWNAAPARTAGEALPPCFATHGGHDVLTNGCGDTIRHELIKQVEKDKNVFHGPGTGWPALDGWPVYDDVTHQIMWADWIERSYRYGLRVIVALAHNNRTLAKAINGIPPYDDQTAGIQQITQIRAFVSRHPFMEIALTPADLRRIVQEERLAVVLGIELDDIAADPSRLEGVIQTYHSHGVRYVFPIHLTDNALGGTAIYENLFHTANRHQYGKWWSVACAKDATITHRVGDDPALLAARFPLLGIPPTDRPPPNPDCSYGHVNARGLTPAGYDAILKMMRRGMIIDIDHMSQKAADQALEMADRLSYPVNSGHSGPRHTNASESSRTQAQYKSIARLGGLAGVGWQAATARTYAANVRWVSDRGVPVALGTDANSMVDRPPPPAPNAPSSGYRWDYRRQGVAHYGLIPEFLEDVRSNDAQVVDRMFDGAEAFATMWAKAEQRKSLLPAAWSGGICSRADHCAAGEACVASRCEYIAACTTHSQCPSGHRCQTEGGPQGTQDCFPGAVGCACYAPHPVATPTRPAPDPSELYNQRLGTACQTSTQCSAGGVSLVCLNTGRCGPFSSSCVKPLNCQKGWTCRDSKCEVISGPQR
jgi:microsomal dipeptidase-like Zn-dependent dipeptidase